MDPVDPDPDLDPQHCIFGPWLCPLGFNSLHLVGVGGAGRLGRGGEGEEAEPAHQPAQNPGLVTSPSTRSEYRASHQPINPLRILG